MFESAPCKENSITDPGPNTTLDDRAGGHSKLVGGRGTGRDDFSLHRGDVNTDGSRVYQTEGLWPGDGETVPAELLQSGFNRDLLQEMSDGTFKIQLDDFSLQG